MYLQIQNKIAKFKLKSPNLGIHIISDIDKINRKVTLRLLNNKIVKIGTSSHCLYIGAFIRNIEFTNFNIDNNKILNKKITQNIKKEIKNYLKGILEDPDLEDIKLYSEVQNG
jgi:hypothetical protein